MSNSEINEITYDAAIIGAGPGGYVAAIRLAQLGLKIVIIEKQHMGGICLNFGCIPTKALLKSSEVFHMLSHAKDYGVSCDNLSFDLEKIVQRSRQVAENLASGIGKLMKKNKVAVVNGHGKFNGTIKDASGANVNIIKVSANSTNDNSAEDIVVKAKNVIVATGARARILPGMEPDGDKILTYKEAMLQTKLPKSLLIVGSGAIGIEFASFYNSLGTKVTIAEIAPRILPVEDAEIAAIAQKSFKEQGIEIYTSCQVQSLKKSENKVNAKLLQDGKLIEIEVEKVIMAVGIVANTENIGLETTKIEFEKGFIKTDKYCLADAANSIYAIGDVTSPPWLAHKASHEAVMVAEKIAGLPVHAIKTENIPGCTYSTPQIASIGLTEEKLLASGRKIKVGRFPFMANGKALALGEKNGLVKTIFAADSGELLGAHMIGVEVTELIGVFALGKTMEATELDFMHTIFPHPTLSEMIHESVLDAFGRALHM